MRKRSFLIFCSIFGAITGAATFNLQLVQPSIDSSYTYIYSMLILHKFPDSSVAITYGPLGFIIHTLDIDHLKLISCIINTLLGGATGYLLYLYLRKIHNRQAKYALAALGALVVAWQVYEWKLLAIFLLLTLYAYLYRPTRSLYILSVASALALYAKLSLGVTCVAILLVLCLLLRTNIKTYLKLLASGCITLLIGGLAFFESLHQAASYLYYGISVSEGYSNAMGYYLSNWKIVIVMMLAGIALVLTGSLLAITKTARRYILIFLVAGFFVWKASITRQDPYGHVESMVYFLAFVSYMVLLLAIRHPLKKKQLIHRYIPATLMITGVLLTGWAAHVNGLPLARVKNNLIAPLTFWHIDTCTLGPCAPENGLALSPQMKAKLSNDTVDIFPYETLFAYANHLNWDPRPSPASYGAYMPELDNLDASFLNSTKAPKYIIWDMRQDILGIDGRHKFLDEPATLVAMLNNYNFDSQYGPLILLKHSHVSQSIPGPVYGKQTSLKWNTWYKLPADTTNKSLVSIKYSPNLNQEIDSIIFRPAPTAIELQKRSGATATYRIVPANMSQGMLLSQIPFTDSEMISVLKHQPLQDPVVKFQLIGNNQGSISASYTK